jgi:hypothetical protein
VENANILHLSKACQHYEADMLIIAAGGWTCLAIVAYRRAD